MWIQWFCSLGLSHTLMWGLGKPELGHCNPTMGLNKSVSHRKEKFVYWNWQSPINVCSLIHHKRLKRVHVEHCCWDQQWQSKANAKIFVLYFGFIHLACVIYCLPQMVCFSKAPTFSFIRLGYLTMGIDFSKSYVGHLV